MRSFLRLRGPLLATLALLIGLTGLGTAMARGTMAADGILCGDAAVQVVLAADGLPLFDADGAPVTAQGLPCLDCVFGALAPLHGGPTLAAPLPRRAEAPTIPGATPRALLWRMGGRGRSPPIAA